MAYHYADPDLSHLENREEPICPSCCRECGDVWFVEWDDNNQHRVECDYCRTTYIITRHVKTLYSTERP